MTSARQLIRFLVVLPPRLLLLDLAGPLEVLRVANAMQDKILFEVSYVAPDPVMGCSIGLGLTGASPLPEQVEEDVWVLLPGRAAQGFVSFPDPAADEDAEQRLVSWLRQTIQPTHRLIMVCEGALLAAKAGLLAGAVCTTHHEVCGQLAALAPSAKILTNRLFVEDHNRLSSAGVTAGIDLMLHLVARWCGAGVAVKIARLLVVYIRRGPNDPQLSPWLEARNHLHPVVHRAQDEIAANPAHDWSLDELGRLAGASARNLSRLFIAHTGLTVMMVIHHARLALVQTLLEQTEFSIEQVAERAGFASARHMRRIWSQCHSQTPTEFRQAVRAKK